MLESYIEKQGHQKVKDEGGFYLKLSALHFVGMPDRLILLKNATVAFVELKRDGGVLSKKQEHVHGRLRVLGFKVYVVYSVAELQLVIDKLIKESNAKFKNLPK